MLPPEIEESLQEFSQSLNSRIPLRHHCEYMETKLINCEIQAEKNKAIQHFRKTVLIQKIGKKKREFAENFHSEVDKLAEEHRKKNEDFKDQAHSLLNKRRMDLCTDFKSATETKLLLNPEMDLKSIEELVEAGKESAKSHFEYHSNYGTDGLYCQEQKKGLELLTQELTEIGNTIVEQQQRHLKRIADGEARKLLEELKKSVLEMSKKVETDSQRWNVTKRKLMEKIQKIHNYVVEEGSNVLSEGKNRELYFELLKLEADRSMSAEEFIEWTQGLNIELSVEIEDGMSIQELIKEEVVEIEDESLNFETPEDMDIDIKLELGGLVLQKSCEKPDQPAKRSHFHNLEEGNADLPTETNVIRSKRAKVSEAKETETISSAGVNENCASASLHENLQAREDLSDKIDIDTGVGQSESLTQTRNKKQTSSQFLSLSIISPSEMDTIEIACQEFREGFHTSATLNDFSQLRDIAEMNASVKLEKRKSVNKLMELIPDENLHRVPYLLNELYLKIQKIIDETAAKNEDHQKQIDFFTRHIQFASESFTTTLEATKFIIKPDTDGKSLENVLKSLKLSTITNFENYCGHKSNAGFFQEQKRKLTEKLDFQGQEVLKNLTGHVNSGEAEFMEIEGEEDVDRDPKLQTSTVEPTASRKSENFEINPSCEVTEQICKNDLSDINSIDRNPEIMSPDRFPVDLAWVLNVPDKDGYVPLLRAISEGHSIASIKMMLDGGANVNVTTVDTCKFNAAYVTITSLIDDELTLLEASAILNLLVEKGFTGAMPLHYAMQYHGFNEELLTWFYNNSADFNAVDPICGDSVLQEAIFWGQDLRLIRKIVDFGGNPKHVNLSEQNVLHVSADSAYDSALEMFIDDIDVNAGDQYNNRPLHCLFRINYNNDYRPCLKMLLRKGADFNAQNNDGDVPMVKWVKWCKDDCFPALMKVKDWLPITQEIASATLTAIVQEMERLKEYLPIVLLSSPAQESENEFAQFITFLIHSKNGKLQLKDEQKWKLYSWEKLDKIVLTSDYLKSKGLVKLRGEMFQVKATSLGRLEYHSKRSIVRVRFETVLIRILASKNFDGFVTVCQCLKEFCK